MYQTICKDITEAFNEVNAEIRCVQEQLDPCGMLYRLIEELQVNEKRKLEKVRQRREFD